MYGREKGTHRSGGLAASGADVPCKIVRRCLGSNEFKQLLRITRPTLCVLLCLLNEQFCHLSLSLSLQVFRSDLFNLSLFFFSFFFFFFNSYIYIYILNKPKWHNSSHIVFFFLFFFIFCP